MSGEENPLRQHVSPQLLGYAGVLPVAGLLALGWSKTDWQAQALSLAGVYGALILSFLGGIHWGFATHGTASKKHFFVSVIPSLWAWVALAVPDLYALISIILGLVLFFVYETNCALTSRCPNWYLPLRLRLTVALSLDLAGFLPLATQ